MGQHGPIGLNFLAVDLMMTRLGIDDDERMDFWSKCQLISSHVIRELREAQQAAENQANKSRR